MRSRLFPTKSPNELLWGFFLDAVVDVHSDNNVEKNAGGGNTKNTPLGGVVSTSVHPREETMMRHHKPDALESVEYSADGALFASISSEKNAVHVLDASTTEEVHKSMGSLGRRVRRFLTLGGIFRCIAKAATLREGQREERLGVGSRKGKRRSEESVRVLPKNVRETRVAVCAVHEGRRGVREMRDRMRFSFTTAKSLMKIMSFGIAFPASRWRD